MTKYLECYIDSWPGNQPAAVFELPEDCASISGTVFGHYDAFNIAGTLMSGCQAEPLPAEFLLVLGEPALAEQPRQPSIWLAIAGIFKRVQHYKRKSKKARELYRLERMRADYLEEVLQAQREWIESRKQIDAFGGMQAKQRAFELQQNVG